MDKIELTVLIPARNEDMLDRTLQDLLENIEANTEIIVVLDGWIPNPGLRAVAGITCIEPRAPFLDVNTLPCES